VQSKEWYFIVPTFYVGMPPRTLRVPQSDEEAMARDRYRITEPDKPHFLTCTVLEWLPVFTRPETVGIILDSWRYLREHGGLRLHGYVVLENHLHFIAQAERLDNCVKRFRWLCSGVLLIR
jgi:hypothetical protein